MKNIIVPLDFSELSLKGLDLAIILAAKYKAGIQVVHVLKDSGNEYKSDSDKETREVNERLAELTSRYSSGSGGIRITSIVKHGKVHQQVVDQADAYDDAIIVMSTHGGSGFEQLFIGSNAFKIISSTTRPVISLRGEKVPGTIRKIILPLDVTNETREKVPFTAALAVLFKAEVHVVTVTSAQVEDINRKIENYASQVEHYLKNLDVKCVRKSLYGGNLTDITIEYANSVEADLISIMSEQEKSIGNILLGNYAQQMVNKSEIPVLVISNRHIGIVTESFKTEGIYYEQ